MVKPCQAALRTQHVGQIPLGFFASPAYIDQHGAPVRIEELAEHALIGPDRAAADLTEVARLTDLIGRPIRFSVQTDSHPAQLAAIRAGLGIGVAHVPVGQRDLVRILPQFTVAELDVWVVTHEDLRHAPRIDAVFSHMVTHLKPFCRLRTEP